jgi:cytochrome oxidase Cu insertion factor (SCO1/SenC/PrrC family)
MAFWASRRWGLRIRTVATGLIVAVVVVIAAVVVITSHSASATPSPVDAFSVNRTVPNLRLLDEHGHTVSLNDFRGKYVVLTPFLTLCHEVCPLTTGAYLQMEHAIRAAGLGNRVVLIEASVDPWRDSPRRLRRFARLTQLTFPLLTGTPQQVAALWKFFQVAYRRVPETGRPDTDPITHKPLTFDVQHTDGLFFIDPNGRERLLMLGMPGLNGLSPVLKALLSDTGRVYLRNRKLEGWTVPQALHDLSYLVGKPIHDRSG